MIRRILARRLNREVSEQAALEEALEGWEMGPTEQTALLVLTEDAGSATALRFYTDALDIGPALASPAAFPWCLANAPCGTIARRYGVVGPNVTWMVDDLDDPTAYSPAVSWMCDHSTPAVLVALRFIGAEARLVIWAWDVEGRLPAPSDFVADWRNAAAQPS